MKKIIFAAFFACITAFSTQAQEKGKIEFGVNVGYNSSTVTTTANDYDYDYGNGLNLGVSGEYYFSDRWGIKAKVIYDQKGFNNVYFIDDQFDPGSPSYLTNVNLNYLTIPVMANWHFARNRNWYLNFGPYAGFLLSAKETQGGNDVKDGFETTDFGLSAGVGIKIPVSQKLKISLEYEFQSGFSDLTKAEGTFQNNRGAFNVGLNFLLK